METNEPPHTGNLKGSSPLSTSSFPENSPGGPSNSHFITLSPPHHLLTLPLSSPTLSLSLCSLSFNFPHYSPRLALENWSFLLQHHPFLVYRSVRTLSDVSMEAVGCAVGSFVLWHHCSPPPITEILSPLCWAQIKSAERLWISTAESSHCSCCSRLQILDWQAILALFSS